MTFCYIRYESFCTSTIFNSKLSHSIITNDALLMVLCSAIKVNIKCLGTVKYFFLNNNKKMNQPRAKRKSSAGVAEAVRLLQKKPRRNKTQVAEEQKKSTITPTIACAVCDVTEGVSVQCSNCSRQLHRLCSNDICVSLNVNENGVQAEDFGDQSFCSRECYSAFIPTSSMRQFQGVNRPLFGTNVLEEQHPVHNEDIMEEPEVQLHLQDLNLQDCEREEAQENSTHLDSTCSSSIEESWTTPPSNVSDTWILKQMVNFCPTKEDWMDNKTYKTVGPTTLVGKVTEMKLIRKNDPTSKLYLVCKLEANFSLTLSRSPCKL